MLIEQNFGHFLEDTDKQPALTIAETTKWIAIVAKTAVLTYTAARTDSERERHAIYQQIENLDSTH